MSLIKTIEIKNKPNPQNHLWNYFDDISVIAIPCTNRDNIKQNLKFIQNYNIRIFQPANKIINNGAHDISLIDILQHGKCDSTCQNITGNHLSLIETSYNNGKKNILIFEDDIIFEENINLTSVFNWLKHNEWDVFFFGYCQWPYPLSYFVDHNIVNLTSPMGTMCYAVSRKGMEKIINYKNNEMVKIKHIDRLIGRDIILNKYGVFPSICFQAKEPALYKKALTKFPINIDMKYSKLSRIIQNISLSIPIIFFIACIIIVIEIFIKMVI